MKNLNIYNETLIDLKEYKEVLRKVFKEVLEDESFSIIFVSDEKMKSLNETYRKINETTDVLSFISDEEKYLGDVFISIDRAKEQAKLYDHTIIREISFLAVHSYLHLKGYTHETKEDEKKMNELTENMLAKHNLKRGK